ncbi:hAT dimerization domain, ribonuclease H-like domain protein, partial [Tanacetum coccineum]
IYDMIRACDTDKPCLHLVYEMWDSMIEKVKFEIYKKEKRPTSQRSLFYDVVKDILVARWTKNNTPLHCLAHSLNPRYYSDAWLLEDSTRSAPHRDAEISQERINCFRRLFPSADEHSMVLNEYAMFSMKSGVFSDLTSISMMGTMEPKSRNPNDDEKMWDVGGDAFDSMEDVGFLEFADLSLDEPEFENDFIIDTFARCSTFGVPNNCGIQEDLEDFLMNGDFNGDLRDFLELNDLLPENDVDPFGALSDSEGEMGMGLDGFSG